MTGVHLAQHSIWSVHPETRKKEGIRVGKKKYFCQAGARQNIVSTPFMPLHCKQQRKQLISSLRLHGVVNTVCVSKTRNLSLHVDRSQPLLILQFLGLTILGSHTKTATQDAVFWLEDPCRRHVSTQGLLTGQLISKFQLGSHLHSPCEGQ